MKASSTENEQRSRLQERGARIKTHLFIISPNNSGSTFLKNALATSRKTWNLQREGQNTFGFRGPRTSGPSRRLPPSIWAARDRWLQILADEREYDWVHTRKAWYLQAFALDPERAEVFVEKSPPFLVHPHSLRDNFPNARFLFLVRNPYAVSESIIRREKGLARNLPLGEALKEDGIHDLAAMHIVNCFKYQRENIERFGDVGAFFTYERMCRDHGAVEERIGALVPALDDLNLDRKLAVKGTYHERLRDMNRDQIGRLTSLDMEKLNRTFRPYRELLGFFGYGLMGE